MKKNFQRLPSGISKLLQGTVMAVMAVAFLAIPVASNAQTTSAGIRGEITDQDGNSLANATVTVRNDVTGFTRSTQTGASGEYRFTNLPISDSYTVVAASSGYNTEQASDVGITLGRFTPISIVLGAVQIEEIVATGVREDVAQVAVGPNASFGLDTLQNAPAINRNISDVLRADSRIYVDESRGGINAIQCGGKNSRFNSLTVDGVRMNDSFGLNSNGYPTERMPFSYDALKQISVELAPFDVEYGNFEACNINAVTKSGENEFFGSAFYDYTNDDLSADELEGDKIALQSYSEKRYGVTLGGPIIKDELFFFVAYEGLDGVNLFDRGPQGSGAVNEVLVSQFELDEIARIARDVYQYDVGEIPSQLDNEDEKLLIKLDWNINDQHRLAYTYTYNDGFNWTASDRAQNEIEFTPHLYERGAELNSHAASLYSDWNSSFSTEIRLAYFDLDMRQVSIDQTSFGEMRIELDDVDVYIGGDDSRQSNDLDYDVTSIMLKGKYDLGGHYLTFGYEREDLHIFNLFVQHTESEYRFNGLADFENGIADDIYYNNAPSHNPLDAAADWGYQINTLYIQDEFDPTDRLTVVAGLRYDWYTTSDSIPTNPDFLADYGFSNDQDLDGVGLLQPRVGITFDVSDQTVIRGGVGLYSGGNPNVWLSNNYSANNTTQFGAYLRDYDLFADGVTFCALQSDAPAGAHAGWGIPCEMYDQISGGTGRNFEINYLDPDFELPAEWKIALGIDHLFDNGLQITGDILVTEGQDSAMILHGDLEQVGTNPDGYPIYDQVREGSFVLTNSKHGNRSQIYSIKLAKSHANGIDWNFGYTYTNAEDVQPMTSSVAFSNYQNRAFFDPQEDVLSTSNYEIQDRFTGSLSWRREILGDKLFRISLYGHAHSGRPYSIAYNGTIDPYGFTPYLDFRDNVLMPGEKRNAYTGSWWRKLDMRISMEFPGFSPEHRGRASLTIDNLTNLLNDDWGVWYQHNFPRTVREGTAESRLGNPSRYEIRFGIEYDF